jgi:hypothetical protein
VGRFCLTEINHSKVAMSYTDRIRIEIRDLSGTWAQIDTCLNDSQMIAMALTQAKERFPDRSVRAVDPSGRLVDMRP